MPQRTFNPHLQRKAKLYHRSKGLINILQTAAVLVYLLFIHISGISGRVSHMTAHLRVPAALLLYLPIFCIPVLLIFILSSNKEYIIEKRFGLSHQNRKGWWSDQLKAFSLGIVLGYPLLLLLFLLFSRAPRYWWVLGACGFSLVQLLLSFLFPVLILPIFFTQEKLEDERLDEDIRRLFSGTGIALKGIYSFNLSAKTRRENALVTGIWKTRRVLIADTLLKKRTASQIIVVLAHEVGHHIKRHMMKLLGVSLFGTGILFFTINSIMRLWDGFPADFEATLALLPVFLLVAGAVSVPVMIGTNAYSRQKELEADRASLDFTRDPDSFITVMAGLADSNLALLHPNPIKVLLFFSHPPVGKRIELAKQYGVDILN